MYSSESLVFSPSIVKYTFESTLTENAVAKYDYRALGSAFGIEDLDDLNETITGTNPNTEEANAMLADSLSDQIAEDIDQHPISDELDQLAGQYDEDTFVSEATPHLEEFVSVETVDLTVQASDQ